MRSSTLPETAAPILDHPTIQAAHTLDAGDAVAALASDAALGLSTAEAARRLRVAGPNSLPEAPTRSVAKLVLHQFQSPLVYLLFVAAGIALALRAAGDAAVILVVVMLNAGIGAFQEGRAERTLAALRRLGAQEARVIRDGAELLVPARDVVPGEVIVLQAGDAVAADARLLEGSALQIAEAALTGESAPVAKSLPALAHDTPLADRSNMVHAGTHVAAGRARALVVRTGGATEIGRIAALAEATAPPPTPLERRIAHLGRALGVAALVTFVLICGLGLARGLPAGEILMIGIGQLVGMVPEGLPVAMTIALAVGVQRMARRRAVVRRLAAVETLGSTTVICSDKTGTLTRNEMTVAVLWLPDGRDVTVSGLGYAPQGELQDAAGRRLDAGDGALGALLEALVLCNDAELEGPRPDGPPWRPLGDPTEAALLTLALKAGMIPAELRRAAPRQAEIPFDAGAKLMATQHRATAGGRVYLKGAPEALLPLCATGPAATEAAARRPAAAQGAATRMAAQALRVLAVARVDGGEIQGGAGFAPFRGRATLLGLVGQSDPPRAEAKAAVALCRAAGIRPVMVTGDHRGTGFGVAQALGIAQAEDEVVTGAELDRMTDAELGERVASATVFARVHPAQKLRIVEALQRRHEVVAMTGDGVNDAPALVRADVGVAMGATGTEVAKQAAKIVLGDDSFATLVAAIEEGRVVYGNIQKAVLFLLSTSIAEVLVLVLALVVGLPPPFAAVQILWNNLVTEGVIIINLVMEPAEGSEMRRPPVSPSAALVDRPLLARMALLVPTIAAITLGWFAWRTAGGVPAAQVRTETFTLLAVCEWFNVLNCRSASRSAISLTLLKNPWLLGGLLVGNALQVAVVFWGPLGRLFHTVPFSLREVVWIGALGSLVLWVEEARKLLARRRLARAGESVSAPRR